MILKMRHSTYFQKTYNTRIIRVFYFHHFHQDSVVVNGDVLSIILIWGKNYVIKNENVHNLK